MTKTPFPRILKRIQKGLRVVLYHHIDEECSFTRQINVSTPPEVFESHLRRMALDYDFVSFDDVLSNNLPRRPLLVTFDDAYRSVLDNAAPILKSFKIKPLFFLCTSPILTGEIILDNLLCHAENESPELLMKMCDFSEGNLTNQILKITMLNRTAAQRLEFRDELAAAMGSDARSLGESSKLYLKPEEIRTLADEYQFSFGGHTRSHVHVRALKGKELEEEITQPMEEIARMTGSKVESFSFPFGNMKDGTGLALRHIHEHVQKVFYVHSRVNKQASDQFIFRSSIGSMKADELGTELEAMNFLRRIVAGLKNNHPLTVHKTRNGTASE